MSAKKNSTEELLPAPSFSPLTDVPESDNDSTGPSTTRTTTRSKQNNKSTPSRRKKNTAKSATQKGKSQTTLVDPDETVDGERNSSDESVSRRGKSRRTQKAILESLLRSKLRVMKGKAELNETLDWDVLAEQFNTVYNGMVSDDPAIAEGISDELGRRDANGESKDSTATSTRDASSLKEFLIELTLVEMMEKLNQDPDDKKLADAVEKAVTKNTSNKTYSSAGLRTRLPSSPTSPKGDKKSAMSAQHARIVADSDAMRLIDDAASRRVKKEFDPHNKSW